MLTQEYIQLVKVLQNDKLLEFAKLFFLCKYKGEGSNIEGSKWRNTYILTILRQGTKIKRFIHISDATQDFKAFITDHIGNISEYSGDKVYRKLECICLSQVEDKQDIIEYSDIQYGIAIDISDFEIIGKAIENNKTLKDFLITSPSNNPTQPTKFNRKNKMLYDLFSTGNKIADIKNSFISSYIQYYLLEMGSLTERELKDSLKVPLPNLSSQAFDDAIQRSRQYDIIMFDKGKYNLTDTYKMQLEEMQAVTTATEERLLKQFEECLNEYGLKDLSHFILDTILELYKAQNKNELATLYHTDDSDTAERKLLIKLFDSLTKKGIDNRSVNTIVQKILDIVSDSEYLNKVSATTLFTSLFNSNSLEDYLDTQKRVVYLDTQILLQLLCVDYQDVAYEDSLYEAGKILYNQLKESQDYVSLFTTLEYVREVSNHFYEAYNLKYFIDLPFIRDLGPSKNIFYNFYLYLNEKEKIPYSCYEKYLEDLLNTDNTLPSNYYNFVEIVDVLVINILENMCINVQSITSPTNLSALRRDYDNLLGTHPKGNKARENDVLCMHYLSDQTNFVNTETGLSDEPYLITLDTTIISMRKKLVERYQRSYWYIYPPLKFANRLSIMNLKLDSRKINYEIICMAETNFKASYDTISMLDIMSRFFNKEEIGNKKLPRMLARMKTAEKNDDYFREYSEKNNNNLPIDVVLNDIHKHYRKQGREHFDNISRLFEIDELSDRIVKLLKEGCETLLKKNKIEEQLYTEFDKLIKQYISSTLTHN